MVLIAKSYNLGQRCMKLCQLIEVLALFLQGFGSLQNVSLIDFMKGSCPGKNECYTS